MQSMQKLNKLSKHAVVTDDDDDDDQQNVLGFSTKARSIFQHTVHIDENIVNPSYYRRVVQMLMDANEGDVVIFMINSNGGQLAGLQALLEGIRMSEASTMAVLTGACHSAASIFALNCDTIAVTESATMLCHYVSYGTGGKGSDVLAHVEHTTKISNKLVHDTYKDFLTAAEIKEMIAGREIYLDAEEISTRLELREKLRAEELEPETKPAKKQSKKKVSKDAEPTAEHKPFDNRTVT